MQSRHMIDKPKAADGSGRLARFLRIARRQPDRTAASAGFRHVERPVKAARLREYARIGRGGAA